MNERLTLFQRLAVAALRIMTRRFAGYEMTPIHEEMVRTHGIRGTMRLSKMGGELSQRLAAEFGDATAQLLIGIAAMWNGCRYCVIGHIYSANLFTFRNQSVLGPLDEHELVDLMRLPDDENLAVLRSRFAGPDHQRTWSLIERMFQLRFRDPSPAERIDNLLKTTLVYWEWLNECTIILGVEALPGTVPALGFMRPPPHLCAAYAEARARSRAQLPSGPHRD